MNGKTHKLAVLPYQSPHLEKIISPRGVTLGNQLSYGDEGLFPCLWLGEAGLLGVNKRLGGLRLPGSRFLETVEFLNIRHLGAEFLNPRLHGLSLRIHPANGTLGRNGRILEPCTVAVFIKIVSGLYGKVLAGFNAGWQRQRIRCRLWVFCAGGNDECSQSGREERS